MNSQTFPRPDVARDREREQSWGKTIASVLAALVALAVVGLMLMDLHLSYKHIYVENNPAVTHHVSQVADPNVPNFTDYLRSFKLPDSTNLGEQIIKQLKPDVLFDHIAEIFPNSILPSEPVPKIAYIFAGSARSFVCPQVHWSIKANLIDALGGEPHTFIRMSLEDNKNVKTGTGIIFKPQHDEIEINETLKLLNPDKLERFSFSNQEIEMKLNHPQPIHTVFRENDQRRYSMFYHRCQAYKLMLAYEKEHNVRFDWVVLARVDAAWLEPILPIQAYADDRVWITETGYDRFNDQFMLIPRQFSDYLYDLDTKVKQGVYCLGGPDVERWKCDPEQLRQKGVSEEKIQSVLPYCCPDVLNKDTNHIGRSERIHYKHLETGKIPLGIGRFPTFLTRRMPDGECVGECFRIYAYHYKEYVFRFDSAIYPYLKEPVWPDTRGRSISSRDRNLCYMYKEKVHAWHPVSAAQYHGMIAAGQRLAVAAPASSSSSSSSSSQLLPVSGLEVLNSFWSAGSGGLQGQPRYHVDYTKKLSDPQQVLHPSIPLNPKDTEVWRIHPTWNTEGCLTFNFRSKEVAWESCKGHSSAKSNVYIPTQLFFLYVVPQKPAAAKYIRDRSYHAYNWFPESTYSANVPNYTRVMMVNSEPVNMDFRRNAYCLAASALKQKATVQMAKCSSDPNDPLQSFLTVRTQADGSHPQSTNGQLSFAAAPHLCVCRNDNAQKDLAVVPENDKLFVYNCEWRAHYHKNIFEFELIGS
jgi:hypothetical protein